METFVCIECTAIVNAKYVSPIDDMCMICYCGMSVEEMQQVDIENIKEKGHSNNDYIS